MPTSRLEAFSDGVLAVIITIMVLELHVPEHEFTLDALREEAGLGLLTYLLTFIYIGIYWNNHHNMFQLVDRVDGAVLWANLALLFMLSLMPFTTQWMDLSDLEHPTPVVVYGVNLLAAAIAYFLLVQAIFRANGPDSRLREAIGRDVKGRLSPVLYVLVILGAAFIDVWIGISFYVVVAVMWLIPDRRAEKYVAEHGTPDTEPPS
jgi:uncharacterized membrane protein